MEKPENEIYGIRIVPKEDESGLAFGGFEGIVIYSFAGYNNIEISRVEKTENGGYHTAFFIKIPFEETIEHTTSGRAKAEFLLSEAKKFAKEGEEIAICGTLVPNLEALDIWWDNFQKMLAEQRK